MDQNVTRTKFQRTKSFVTLILHMGVGNELEVPLVVWEVAVVEDEARETQMRFRLH